MAFDLLTARRVVFAGAFAFALTLGPAVPFLSPAGVPAPRTLADSSSDGCTSGESIDAYSLVCVPDVVPNFNSAPSEMQLTEENPGIASPGSHGGR